MSVGEYLDEFGDLVRKDRPVDSEVLLQDQKSKDRHVRRDPRLIRLTGSHPFNCEAPLTELYEHGFITPHQLHYVRNHGAVPEVSENSARNWTITIDGLVEKPLTLQLHDIMSEFEVRTLPITLVCAGNRRKEQNMVRKGNGFNWGSAGVSTSLWTGVLLSDILSRARPHRKAHYVYFEGADNLPADKYGTCVRREWAMDFHRAIMICWKQNGLELTPDHGFPVRVIVPGVIGGRSVKWLKHITLAEKPSENWYHIHDNRVLPTMVSPDIAKHEQKWWHDERYAIYNLNIQSVIVYPQHNEILPNTSEGIYTIKGFAYNGGGIRIGRVEVSLDGGSSWRLACIRYPEDEYRELGINELFGGKVDLEDRYLCFCWCFWYVEVAVSELREAKDIVVRAMDVNMNIQPRDMYWSVLSMLNNSWFRITASADEGTDGIKFQHPTNLLSNDGWMDKVKALGGNPSDWGHNKDGTARSNQLFSAPEQIEMTRSDCKGVVITRKELENHANPQNPWFVVKGEVYNATGFLENHPGGVDSITMIAGEDATDDFMAIHSETAKRMLADYHVGTLEESESKTETPHNSCTITDGYTEGNNGQVSHPVAATFLNPKIWKRIQLLQKIVLSSDVRLFNFALESPEQTSGLPVGGHVYVRMHQPGSPSAFVMRAYTPVSCHRTKGLLSLLVKIYFPSGGVPGGQMSMALEALQPGDWIEVKGPLGTFEYLGGGIVRVCGRELSTSQFYMVSGGSGITPCYQVIKELVHDSNDPTHALLLFGNKREEDILCRAELTRFQNSAPGRVSINYWLSKLPPPVGWKYNMGRIDASVLDTEIKKESFDTSMLLVCGPDGMVQGVRDWAVSAGYPVERLIVF